MWSPATTLRDSDVIRLTCVWSPHNRFNRQTPAAYRQFELQFLRCAQTTTSHLPARRMVGQHIFNNHAAKLLTTFATEDVQAENALIPS